MDTDIRHNCCQYCEQFALQLTGELPLPSMTLELVVIIWEQCDQMLELRVTHIF